MENMKIIQNNNKKYRHNNFRYFLYVNVHIYVYNHTVIAFVLANPCEKF